MWLPQIANQHAGNNGQEGLKLVQGRHGLRARAPRRLVRTKFQGLVVISFFFYAAAASAAATSPAVAVQPTMPPWATTMSSVACLKAGK